MSNAVRDFFEAHPVPDTAASPIGGEQLGQIDDNLHLGWSWYRYRSVFRRFEAARILDAGCGTGLTTLGLARLNPGASVLGVDVSPRSIALGGERLTASRQAIDRSVVKFRVHDLGERLTGPEGPFDFIVCRDVLPVAEEPARLLENLRSVIDARGLLQITIPGLAARHAARQLGRAVNALLPEGATATQRAEVGLELFRSLRPDHPLRLVERQASGAGGPGLERLLTGYFSPVSHELSLEEVISLLRKTGWQFLYEACTEPWRPDQVFQASIDSALQDRVAAIDEGGRAVLRDALDPARPLFKHCLYACLAEFEPRTPSWPEKANREPAVIDHLIPHPTGLVAPVVLPASGPAESNTRFYRVVTGALGPVEPLVDQSFRACDGKSTCGQITARIERNGVREPQDSSRMRWLEMANRGFVVLEPADPRQIIDCTHLGLVRDRLDCPCPRLWVRSCELHGYCSIDPAEPEGSHGVALQAASSRLGFAANSLANCLECADYTPEEDEEG